MTLRSAWRVRASCVFFLVILGLSVPNGGFAQPQPTSLSISPSSIVQGQCYTMYVGNGAYMTLDMQYTLNGAAQPPIIGWPTLDGAGTASPCTSSSTPTGNYVFTAIRNTLNTEWVSVYAPITVNPPPPPDFSLSVSPSSATIDQGQTTSYSVYVSPMNGFSSSVSLSVAGLPSGVSASFSPNPVSAGGSSTLTISSSTTAGTGSFGLTVTGSGGGLTRYTYPSLTVNPRQPTSMLFNTPSGYAGNDCYTVTIGNGANMTVDLRYLLNGVQAPDGTITTNANGQYQYCLAHSDTVGTYSFFAMKNHLRADWVNISPSVTYTIYPPQPTSLTYNPTTITAGQGSYRMTVGNGAGITVDEQYNLNGGSTQTITSFASLVAVSPGSPDGQTDISVGVCTPPGAYTVTAIKNTLNTPWVSLSGTVTVNPPPAPPVPSVSPSDAAQGASVVVTLSGSNLCNVSLSTTWPGLSFSNVTSNGSSATATFNIASTAWVGTAPVTLSATGGSTSFNFVIDVNPTTQPETSPPTDPPPDVAPVPTPPPPVSGSTTNCNDISGRWTDDSGNTFALSESGGSVTGTETRPSPMCGTVTWQITGPDNGGGNFTLSQSNPQPPIDSCGNIVLSGTANVQINSCSSATITPQGGTRPLFRANLASSQGTWSRTSSAPGLTVTVDLMGGNITTQLSGQLKTSNLTVTVNNSQGQQILPIQHSSAQSGNSFTDSFRKQISDNVVTQPLAGKQFGTVTATWDTTSTSVTLPSFTTIGVTQFTQYNTPFHSQCSDNPQPVDIIYQIDRTPPGYCYYKNAMLGEAFIAAAGPRLNSNGVVDINGSLTVLKNWQAGAKNVCPLLGRDAAHTFFSVDTGGNPITTIKGSANVTLSDGTNTASSLGSSLNKNNPPPGMVATDATATNSGSPPVYLYSDQILVFDQNDNNDAGGLRSVQDICGACSGQATQTSSSAYAHIDVYNGVSRACTGVPSYGQRYAIRVPKQ